MNRKTYWKDVRKSFSSSKGRVISIASLMALGSFALVGLKATTPNMQHTATTNYFTKHQTADLTLTGSYGLNQSDQDLINQVSSDANIEYGYFKDVVLKNSTDAFRLYSKPKDISTYELVKGKLPSKVKLLFPQSIKTNIRLVTKLTLLKKVLTTVKMS